MKTAMEQILDTLADPLVWPVVALLAIGGVAFVLARWRAWPGHVLGIASGVLTAVCGAQVALRGAGQTFARTWANLGGGIVLRVELGSTPLGMLALLASSAFAVLISATCSSVCPRASAITRTTSGR